MAAVKRILLVDDDPDLREALADQLVMTEEFDVFEAGDGEGGLARAAESTTTSSSSTSACPTWTAASSAACCARKASSARS